MNPNQKISNMMTRTEMPEFCWTFLQLFSMGNWFMHFLKYATTFVEKYWKYFIRSVRLDYTWVFGLLWCLNRSMGLKKTTYCTHTMDHNRPICSIANCWPTMQFPCLCVSVSVLTPGKLYLCHYLKTINSIHLLQRDFYAFIIITCFQRPEVIWWQKFQCISV